MVKRMPGLLLTAVQLTGKTNALKMVKKGGSHATRIRNMSDEEKELVLSLDLDGLDPAFAPGVSHQEPGGLSVRDILSVIHKLKNPIVGADIVELNPLRDINGITATVAGKFLKEFGGMMLEK